MLLIFLQGLRTRTAASTETIHLKSRSRQVLKNVFAASPRTSSQPRGFPSRPSHTSEATGTAEAEAFGSQQNPKNSFEKHAVLLKRSCSLRQELLFDFESVQIWATRLAS